MLPVLRSLHWKLTIGPEEACFLRRVKIAKGLLTTSSHADAGIRQRFYDPVDKRCLTESIYRVYRRLRVYMKGIRVRICTDVLEKGQKLKFVISCIKKKVIIAVVYTTKPDFLKQT